MCQRSRPGQSGIFALASCTLLSPKNARPKPAASSTPRGEMPLLTASRVTEAGSRPARPQAAMTRLSRNPSFNALFRTTCVATKLDGGHADNAWPQRARATVNCRMLPNDPPAEVAQTLARLAGDSVSVTVVDAAVPSEPSPLRADLLSLLEQLASRYFPGAPVLPTMSAGATDGLYLRNAGIPTYSLSAVAGVSGESNAHGLNEKVREKSIYDAVAFWNDMVRGLATAPVP